MIPAVSLLFDEWYPDENEREEFAAKVANELQHADHHLYFTMYDIYTVNSNQRFMVVGRKPSSIIDLEANLIT